MLCCFALTVIACCTLAYSSWWCHMACCCDTCHAPFHRLYHGCSTLSCVASMIPTESAHDAQCCTHHYVCSTTTCYQHSLRCNSSRQSGLAIYFTCLDLANYSVLIRHSICFGDWLHPHPLLSKINHMLWRCCSIFSSGEVPIQRNKSDIYMFFSIVCFSKTVFCELWGFKTIWRLHRWVTQSIYLSERVIWNIWM